MLPETTLSRTQERRRDAVVTSLAEVEKTLDQIDVDAFTNLLVRASRPTTPDGYPTSTRLGSRTAQGGHSSSVESAVEHRQDPRRDPLRDVTRLFEYASREAAYFLKVALDALSYTFQTEDQQIGRQAASNPCAICLVKPAVRSSWCLDDWKDWVSHGRPDRVRWQLFKLQEKNSEGLVLVTVCPPPAHSCKAQVGPYSKDADHAP